MSQNSGYKGYEEFLKAYENNLEKTKYEAPSKPEQSRTATTVRKRKGRYKVIRLRKSAIAVLLILILTVTAIFVVPWEKFSKKASFDKAKTPASKSESAVVDEKIGLSYKFDKNNLAIPSYVDAKSAIIIDKADNSVVASRNAHEKTYPASTTKIMTLLVAVENIKDLSDTFTMTLEITDPMFEAGASVAGFLNGEIINMKDMLYGLILPSGADAALGLAKKIAGSEENFVKLMNKKVSELGLKNTHFANVTGLHDKNNYSSAYDMAIILDTALQNELCKEVLSTYQYTTAKTPQHPEGILLSSTLFSWMYGTEPETATILGGKTGFVNESGYCIASYGKANNTENEYIVVTLGNSGRWPAFYGQIDLYKDFAK